MTMTVVMFATNNKPSKISAKAMISVTRVGLCVVVSLSINFFGSSGEIHKTTTPTEKEATLSRSPRKQHSPQL